MALFLAQSFAFAASKDATRINERISKSASPYLRLHSDDLVEWYSWGPEAFDRAKDLDLPVLVSFGYTACHWCHVMREMHFNDPDIADIINGNFVPVLVDRERRPALDESYMMVTEVLTQRGGWPNTVFLTPQLKPIYGTAYIPPEPFSQLITAIAESWRNDRLGVIARGDRIAGLLAGYQIRTEKAAAVTAEVLSGLSTLLVASFDPFSGGIGHASKFFQAPVLLFLLQRYELDGDEEALVAVETTLSAIRSGGIHDHLEGGFHRYSVDPGWRVPHFEKMLYDQAQMAEVYLEAYRLTGSPAFAETARKTLDYVLADLTAPHGGFYSTRDADSEGEEGTYYVWTPDQLREALGIDSAKQAIAWFDLIGEGEFAGKVILNLDEVADADLNEAAEIFVRLKEIRDTRQKPVRDEKILASWNGMMIASLAHASAILGDVRYEEAAIKAADFIWRNMRCENQSMLCRSYFEGETSVSGELDDYAHVARGNLFLFDLTQNRVWLNRAIALTQELIARFSDEQAGDFYATSETEGFARAKLRSDGDQPSGNGVTLDVLARLVRRTGELQDRLTTDKAIAALSGIAIKGEINGVSILAATQRHQNSEIGPIQYAGDGKVRVGIRPSGPGKLLFDVSVAHGWHVNANQPLDKQLIGIQLRLTAESQPLNAKIAYPEPVVKSLAFNQTPIAVLEGEFTIAADLSTSVVRLIEAELDIQSCSDKICLLPETLSFRLPVR